MKKGREKNGPTKGKGVCVGGLNRRKGVGFFSETKKEKRNIISDAAIDFTTREASVFATGWTNISCVIIMSVVVVNVGDEITSFGRL